MKPSAVLLIDLENFYCSREDYCRDSPPAYDRTRFADDLDKLLGYARSMVEGLPFTVRRAYANFNAARYPGGAPPQYYLRHIPDELMRQGVEPVQVFRLSQNGSKNASDMRMAMDATALLNGVGNVEHFVLVTGDADFIPVILELKRHGHAVSVIGVTGATNALIQRFVDNFELFEDLLAADEVEAQSGEATPASDGLAQVAAAVRKLLERTHPLRFAAVKPLLSKELGHPFDPGLFGCDTTGDFLRKYQAELGVVIRPTQHDQEIDLRGSVAPCANGSKGLARPPERATAKPAAPEPHSREHYVQLLAGRATASAAGSVRVPAVPWRVIVWGCDAIVGLLAPPTGGPTHTTALLPRLLKAAEGVAIPDAVKHLRMFYPILRAGLPVRGADGVYSLAKGTTGEEVRRAVLGYVANLLIRRLAECGAAGAIRAESLAAVFSPGEALETATAEVTAALARLPSLAEPPVPVKPAPSAEALHTPAGYLKLLKAGGAKGSETETIKILPVPWPSVERVCAGVFSALSAPDGGPLPREQLQARLVDAGRGLDLEGYERHVRRGLGILRAAGELIEDGATVSLNPEVGSAPELRNRALAFLLQLLQLRLEERRVCDPIHPRAFAEAVEAGPLAERLIDEVTPFIAWLYQPAEADPHSANSCTVPVELELIPEPGAEAIAGAEPPAPAIAEPDATEVGGDATVEAFASPPAEPACAGSGVVDVAVITSEAVAAAEDEAHPAEEPAEFSSPSAPPVGLVMPRTEDGVVLAVPVADWLPEDDVPRPEGTLNPPLPAALLPLGTAPPLPPEPAPVARITPPPLPTEAGSPPPLPPLPPESA